MRSTNHPLSLIDIFPAANSGDFSREEWISKFSNSNVIIHCHGKNIYYPVHWGPLSVKCAFNGSEYYQKRSCKYAVSDENFLLLNEGTTYSSYIEPGNEVESLTINFSREYQNDVRRVMGMPADRLLDQPFESPGEMIFVEEKLYKHNNFVSPLIFKLRSLSRHFSENEASISETLYFLLVALVQNNTRLIHEIESVDAARLSTKKEIYRRLNEVKDYIDSCSNEDITLESLSKIALMSPFHLLRQFKKNFQTTPYQYLISRRLDRAMDILNRSDATLADICFIAGFRDTSSFCKLFRKKYRLSPQQYRERVRK